MTQHNCLVAKPIVYSKTQERQTLCRVITLTNKQCKLKRKINLVAISAVEHLIDKTHPSDRSVDKSHHRKVTKDEKITVLRIWG